MYAQRLKNIKETEEQKPNENPHPHHARIFHERPQADEAKRDGHHLIKHHFPWVAFSQAKLRLSANDHRQVTCQQYPEDLPNEREMEKEDGVKRYSENGSRRAGALPHSPHRTASRKSDHPVVGQPPAPGKRRVPLPGRGDHWEAPPRGVLRPKTSAPYLLTYIAPEVIVRKAA
jgi:hypothetical protein